MLLIREMLNKIEEEHQTKLQQLDSLKVRQESFFQNSNDISPINNFDSINNTTDSTLPKLSNLDNNKSLTLLDKERMAFQQEQLRRMNSEKPLVPETKVSNPATTSNQTKDLTSTLINHNLHFLQANIKPAQNEYSHLNDTLTKVQYINSNSVQSFHMNQKSSSQLASSSKSNFAAFDSFANISQKSTPQSLNSIKTSSIGPLTPNINNFASPNMMSKNVNQSAKQLSKSELEEFLN